MNKIVAVIPAYNPEFLLIDYINQLLEQGFDKLIIVNDGSKPECLPVFEQVKNIKECTLLVHPENKGKGRALKTAFRYFLENKEFDTYQGVVTADADGQHSPKDTRAVADAITMNKNNFVLGCRDFDSDNVPFKSKKGNKITRNVMHLLFSKRITDTQTGLRGLNRKFIADCLQLGGDRFEYEINMLIVGMRTQNIVEIPIETIYFNQNRASSFKAVKDSVKIYSVIFSSFFKFLFSSLSSACVDILLFNLFVAVVFKNADVSKAIFISTILARVISSVYNYVINRKVVFKSNSGVVSVVKYYILAAVIMLLSAVLVTGVFRLTNFNKSIIKIITDSLLFILSYKVQQIWVFK